MSSLAAVFLVSLLAGPATPGTGQPPPAQAQWVDDPALARALEAGQAYRLRGELDLALRIWVPPYQASRPSASNRVLRNELVLAITDAELLAFQRAHAVERLVWSRDLLARHIAEFETHYAPAPDTEAERKRLMKRLAVLDQRIAGAGDRRRTEGFFAAPRMHLSSAPELARKDKKAAALIGTGAFLVPIGISLAVALGYSGPEQQRAAAIGVGVTIAAIGAVLLPLGIIGRVTVERELRRLSASGRSSWALGVGKGGFALEF